MGKITIEDIKNDARFKQYLTRGKQRKPKTVENIALELCKYSNVIDMTPTEFIKEATQEIKDPDIEPYERKLEEHLIKFRDHMEKKGGIRGKGATKKTVQMWMGTIKTFYASFIKKDNIPEVSNIYNPRASDTQSTDKDLPSITDLKKAISIAKPLYKAMISLGMATGMGRSELRTLTIKDWLNAHGIKIPKEISKSKDDGVIKAWTLSRLKEIDENTVPMWEIKRIKMDTDGEHDARYYTFSTPESNKYIMNYLATRGVSDNSIECSIKPFDYLFEGKKGKPLSTNAITVYYYRLNEKLGLPSPKTDPDRNLSFLRTHAVRKFFRSAVGNAGMENDFAEWFMGHQDKNGNLRTYMMKNMDRARAEYEKVMDCLSIEKVEIRELDAQEKAEMKQEIDRQKKINNAMINAMIKQGIEIDQKLLKELGYNVTVTGELTVEHNKAKHN